VVIKSFACSQTERLANRERAKRIPPDIQATALRKLRVLDAATTLDELRIIPGNGLEALKRDRKGQHSIRINDQWRLCFVFHDGHAYDVEIVDYH
jgi:proteic killer suppression protein